MYQSTQSNLELCFLLVPKFRALQALESRNITCKKFRNPWTTLVLTDNYEINIDLPIKLMLLVFSYDEISFFFFRFQFFSSFDSAHVTSIKFFRFNWSRFHHDSSWNPTTEICYIKDTNTNNSLVRFISDTNLSLWMVL